MLIFVKRSEKKRGRVVVGGIRGEGKVVKKRQKGKKGEGEVGEGKS